MLIGESTTIKLKLSPNDPGILFGEFDDRYYTVQNVREELIQLTFSVYKKGEKKPFYSIKLKNISMFLSLVKRGFIPSHITVFLLEELFDKNGEFLIDKYKNFESKMRKEQLKKIKSKNRLINYEYGKVQTTKDFTYYGLFFDEDNNRIYFVLLGKDLQLTEIVESDLKRLRY